MNWVKHLLYDMAGTRRAKPLAICMMLALLAPSVPGVGAAFGQVTTANIGGTVRDEMGMPISGASITVRNTGTSATRTATTDDDGYYLITQLPLGLYEVAASMEGFNKEVRGGIELTLGREAVIDFTLKVGRVTEEVVVSGNSPLIETSSAVVANLVSEQQVKQLPINLRSFEELSLLQPGVQLSYAPQTDSFSGQTRSISVQGVRPSGNSFLLDGTDINQPYWNRTPGSVSGSLPGVEAVLEFNVVRDSYSAEWGRSSGGVINAVTKSGTNELHGSVYEFLRNDALDAKNFFDLPDRPTPEFKRNQFGFSLGGPIVPNRTFFFGNYEGLRERRGITDVVSVPTLAARMGFLPNPVTGQLEEVAVHPASRVWLEKFHLPNGRDFGNGLAEFIGSRLQSARDDYMLARVDHQLSQKDSLAIRYAFDDGAVDVPSTKWLDLPGFEERNRSRFQYFTLQETRVVSTHVVNAFKFAFNRNKVVGEQVAPDGLAPEFSFRPGTPLGNLFILDIVPVAGESIGTSLFTPTYRVSNVFQFIDDLSYLRGKHALKFGVNIERMQMNDTFPAFLSGTYIFPNIRTFVTGSPLVYQGALPDRGDVYRGYRQSLFGFYVQDDFKVRPNLTINLGLRYEFVTVPTEVNGKISNLRDLSDPEVTVGGPFFNNPSLKNFAPRIGIAWDPTGSGKTSVRAGAGIFYEPFLEHIWGLFPRAVPPFVVVGQSVFPPFPNALEGPIPPSARRDVVTFNPAQPTLYRWSANIQRELFNGTVVQVGYSGSHGIHLTSVSDKNTPIPEILPDGRKFFPVGAPRRNPRLDSVRMIDTNASSWYNALEASLNTRIGNDFQGQISYTFAKALDNASATIGAEVIKSTTHAVLDAYDINLDKGLSAFHVKHNFVANFLYDLPFGYGSPSGFVQHLVSGWGMNGILKVASGQPFNVVLGINRANNRQGSSDIADRPDLKPGYSVKDIILGGPDQYFDPNAFALPEPGTFGNFGRNVLTSPGITNFDFSLIKNTPVGERVRIQFRAEVFNLFNHPVFGPPVRTVFTDASGIPAPNAGRIQSTILPSRQIQFGIKALF